MATYEMMLTMIQLPLRAHFSFCQLFPPHSLLSAANTAYACMLLLLLLLLLSHYLLLPFDLLTLSLSLSLSLSLHMPYALR
uniref:Uncharacterized protein n=1 Tax=Oryza brachyantha TaxID=4533 RepID=J3MTD5_ORYBR